MTKKHNPETEAKTLRERAGARTVPVSLERIAKYLGAEIRLAALDDELSGMIFIKDGVPVIGVNAMHHINRQRFTIAHEIGHLVMHRSIVGAKVHVDKRFPVLMRNSMSSAGTVNIEIEANKFAAALLIPRDVLEDYLGEKIIDIEDDRPLEDLARKFKVSKQAIEYRIRNIMS